MAKKQLDKLVANEIHSLVEYKLKREHLLLEFLMKDTAVDTAPSLVTLADGDSLPMLNSSQLITTPRSISWGRTVVTAGRLISIGGAEIRTDLSIANKTATTLDILSSSGDDITVPAATTSLAGLMTAASLTKLNGIEALADVTDKENVGAAILASPTKLNPVDTDYITILDSAAGNILSKVLWSNVLSRGYLVNQTSHGFVVGDTIKPSGAAWVKTKADSVNNAGTVGVVSEVINSGSFKYITEGIIPGSYTVGANYFLSTTTFGGVMIVTGAETWTVGHVIEYIGTGVATGLHVQIDVGQEISSFTTVDKYVQAMSFDTNTRILSLERTDGLSTLTATIPQYVEVDTLNSVLTRGNTTALGATFGGTVSTPTLMIDNDYLIYKNSNRMILSAPLQLDVFINGLSAFQVGAGGNVNIPGTTTTASLKITSGAAAGYVWTCANVNGSGVWSPIAASNVYKGTWNATTNTPTLADGVGTAGWYYRVTVAGTFNAIAYSVGDDIIYNGTVWQRIPGTGFTLQPATALVLGGVKIGAGITVQLDGTISVNTNYQAPLSGTGLVYSTAGVISYDTNVYATQTWVSTNYSAIGHNHSGLYVPLTRNINTTNSITGGGSLAADRTLTLVGDVVSPGNNYVYGTGNTGTRGWQQSFWLPATGGTYYPGGYVAIGNLNPTSPLHVSYDVAGIFVTTLSNVNATGNGISILANGTALEVKDKANTANPAFQILGDGIIKWQLATAGTGDRLVYYSTSTKQLYVGTTSVGIALTSLSAISPILYDNTTGVFSMTANAYAPFSTVSFPGFGTNHTTAAYGDHVHLLSEITWTAGTTLQYWRGDKSWQSLDTLAVSENTNLYFTNTRSRNAISLTTTGTSGAATYTPATGVFNIPNYSFTQIYVNGVSFNTTSGVLTLTRLNAADLTTSLDGRYSLLGHTHAYEPVLGNPLVDGYLLSSTILGVRSWVAPYVHPVYTVRTITASAGQVINTFNSDGTGHVTGITLRTLIESDIPALSISKITDLANQLSQKQPLDGDLTAISNIASGVGLLKRTGIDSWTIDTTSYISGITYGMVISALGFTPEPALGNPAGNGYVLSSTTGGVRSWIPISGSSGGTVTSVAAGAGMNFTTFTTSGSVVMGTPSTLTTGTSNNASGSTHTHVLDLSGRYVSTQFSLTGGGDLGSDRTLYLVGDEASPSASKYYGTNASAVRGWYALPTPSQWTTDTYGITYGGNVAIGMASNTSFKLDINGKLRSNDAIYGLVIYTDTWISAGYGMTANELSVKPNIPLSGTGQYYVKTDGKPYFQNDAGTEYDLTTGGTDTNNYPTSLSFDNTSGVLTLGRNGLSNLTTGLDSRYSLLTHNHSGTYDYYGSWTAAVNTSSAIGVGSGATLNFKNGTNVSISRSGFDIVFNSTDTNNYPTALMFSAGTLSLSRSGLGDLTVSLDGRYSLSGHTHSGIYEPVLGNPSVSGYVLSSTTGGVRSWVAMSGGGSSAWGSITGTLSAQTDLQNALNAKANLNGNITQYFTAIEFDLPGGIVLKHNTGGFEVYPLGFSVTSSGQVQSQSFYSYGAAGYTFSSGANITHSGGDFYLSYSGTVLRGNSGTGIYATNFILSSDRRLKENIRPIKESSHIDDVELVQFNMIGSDIKRYGIIAQDLEKVEPDLVYDSDNKKTVAYIDFLIIKMARLEQKIDELTKQINNG